MFSDCLAIDRSPSLLPSIAQNSCMVILLSIAQMSVRESFFNLLDFVNCSNIFPPLFVVRIFLSLLTLRWTLWFFVFTNNFSSDYGLSCRTWNQHMSIVISNHLQTWLICTYWIRKNIGIEQDSLHWVMHNSIICWFR